MKSFNQGNFNQNGCVDLTINWITRITHGLLLIIVATVSLAAEDKSLLLGKISFPTSVSGQAQSEFESGVLKLHSFWYEEARDHFRKAQKLDSAFAMAYWGEAMTYDNPLGTQTEEDIEGKGAATVQRIVDLEKQKKLNWSDRERGYVEAVKLRFRPGMDMTTLRRDYGQAMDQLVEMYPDDDEAKAFAALALMSYPAFDREQAAHVVAVAAPLEGIFLRNPEHPGVLHYLIHVYDTPTFAPMGVRQARLYAKIAPASPHALHMPSHIFKHLGLWDEVAKSNEDAYKASVEWQKATDRPLSMRDFHSLDWLLDAYLRLDHIDDAEKIMKELDDIENEMNSRGEDRGQFSSIANSMRMAFQSAGGRNP